MIKAITALGALALGSAAMAQINAAGTIDYTLSGSNYTYDITLHNTGTTTIGTLWYSWIPGQDYLPLNPTATASPAGWTVNVTHAGATDGYAVRWIASAGSLLGAGNSLAGFKFTTTATPAQLLGNSTFFPNAHVGTTFVYEGRPFVGGSKEFQVNPVPEPTSMLALASGVGILLRRRSKNR